MSDLIDRLKHCEENCGDPYLSELAHRAADRLAKLEAFKAAVLGWREFDHPEGFDRRSAEIVADYGREAYERREK